MSKLVCGVGINDADYMVYPILNGKKTVCPFYRAWKNMLVRCYSKNLHTRQPTYIGCSVCEDWLTFSNFKAWMETQDWAGKQLDKDLLNVGNKEYSSVSCVFISRNLNTLLVDHAAKRGAYPIGVYWDKNVSKFVSKISINGKTKYLGLFLTPETAHVVWQQAKMESVFNTAMEQTDEILKDALLLRCTQLQHDIDNGLETIKL